jgi:twitching motility protein PilT
MTIRIEDVLQRATEVNASDILITTGMPPILLIDDAMRRMGQAGLTEEETQSIVYSLLESEQIARFERERELDYSLTFREHRFRGNAFWQRGAVATALRLIPRKIPEPAALGLPPVASELAERTQGLILITGPTGHGKSTTQASLIDHINRNHHRHIITIEDPIEFVHGNRKSIIEQRELGTDTLSFPDALKHALRQAPHVILVGEMRDIETMAAALTAAETGHLVFATLHTNDAVQSVDRIIDAFPPYQQNQIRVQLSASLLAVIGQRLLPSPDGKGRVLAYEVLRNTSAVANLIRDNKTAQIGAIIDTQGRVGMVSMDATIKRLYLEGRIEEGVARRNMRHPEILFGG